MKKWFNDEFDILLFASRDIEEISIPSNIKIISSYAFEFCRYLTNVEIPTDSNLQIIKSNAFYISTICEGALAYCEYLTRVEIASSMN